MKAGGVERDAQDGRRSKEGPHGGFARAVAEAARELARTNGEPVPGEGQGGAVFGRRRCSEGAHREARWVGVEERAPVATAALGAGPQVGVDGAVSDAPALLFSAARVDRLALEVRWIASPVVALDFGGGLGVELSRSRQGIELLVRPSLALIRAAELELPGLVAALRRRGVVVSRATVRRGGGPLEGERAGCVDGRAGLR